MKLCKYTLDDFEGGFSANTNQDTLKSSFTPNSYNVEAIGGAIKTMNGCSKYIDDEIIFRDNKYYPVQLMAYHPQVVSGNSNFDKLFAICTASGSKSVFVYESGEWVRKQGNISDVNMGYIDYYYNDINNLLFCNAIDGIYTYNYLSQQIGYIDDAPGMSAITLHYGRIWGIGNHIHPNTIYYSAQDNPDDWTSDDAGEITVTTYDSDKFIGIANIYDDVVLYRKNSLFRIAGSNSSNYQLRQIPAATGAVGPAAIANNRRYSYYIGEDGIYSFDGTRATVLEDNRLRFLFENKVNKNAVSDACAVIFNNKLYAAVPTDGADHNNTVIEYDIISGVFNIRYGLDVLSFCVFKGELLYTDTSGYICVFDDSLTYKGEKITAHYETPYYDFENKNIVHSLDSVYFTAKGNGQLKISAETENGIRSCTIDLKNNDKFDVYKVALCNTGRRFKFHFDNVDGSSFEITRPEFILEQDDED